MRGVTIFVHRPDQAQSRYCSPSRGWDSSSVCRRKRARACSWACRPSLRPGARAAWGKQRSESAPDSLVGPSRGNALIPCGREIDMRTLVIAAIITSLAAPAFAEEDPSKAEANKAEEQKKKENEEIEKAYKDMLKRTTREQPVKKAAPGGNRRSRGRSPRLAASPA